jgi:GTP-binding protein
MADGALLIVDAQEGPMPQTRFVLKRAFAMNLKVITVINKIDKPHANIQRTLARLDDLFLDLAKTETQLELTILYAVARQGKVFVTLPENFEEPANCLPLLEAIISKIPAPENPIDGPFKMMVSSLDYDNHLGQIVIGKIHQGEVKIGQSIVIANRQPAERFQVETLLLAEGLGRTKTESAQGGEIVFLSGLKGIKVGDTLSDPKDLALLPGIEIGEPTLHIRLSANTSPFAGQEGVYFTSRQLEERLTKEIENNVSLKIDRNGDGTFKISGRGELHLSILLETMRREGYEMEVGKPDVILKTIDGVVCEPIEEVSIIVVNEYTGVINQELGRRLAWLQKSQPVTDAETEFLYRVPTRNIIGLRSQLLTLTKGTVVLSSQVIDFEPKGKSIQKLRTGVIISNCTGKAVEYSLKTIKSHGTAFILPGTKVYEGMIIGQTTKEEDVEINVCKEKNLTNHRKKSHQGITQLAPEENFSLEECIDFLEKDELLEITPLSLRLRKKYLSEIDRRRQRRSNDIPFLTTSWK